MAVTNRKGESTVEQFGKELAAFWSQMPNKFVFGVLAVAWVLLFHFRGNSTFGYTNTPSLFGWLNYIYNGAPDEAHGRYIPFVVLGLFWWKRETLLALEKKPWGLGLPVLVLASFLHVLGYLIQQSRVSEIAFFLGLYGLMGLVWGKAWLKASFFPYFLFVFSIPLGTLGQVITVPLRMLVASVSVALSHGLGIDVVRQGTLIYDAQRSFQYDVAPACSGIRSLIALSALTTIYGFMTFKSAWKRLLMMGMAVPLAVLGNVIRITSVVVSAEAFGQNVGLMVHDWAGFFTFGLAFICILSLGHWLREDESPTLLQPEPA